MRVVIDSYAWIELFIGSRAGNKVKDIISEATEVYTPSIVLAEIARKYFREGFREEDVRYRVRIISDISVVVNIEPEIAVDAGKCYLELREIAKREGLTPPSLADAVILSVARHLNAKILTGDPHFKDLPETIWLNSVN